jgi:hypothetical protein
MAMPSNTPEKLTQEEYHAKFTCPAMKAAVALATEKAPAFLEYLNDHSRLTWELSRIGTSSSLYHGWGAVMHFQACEGASIHNRQWWKVEVYVNMEEDKVTMADKTPGYSSRTRHVTHLGLTYDILDNPAKVLECLSFASYKAARKRH